MLYAIIFIIFFIFSNVALIGFELLLQFLNWNYLAVFGVHSLGCFCFLFILGCFGFLAGPMVPV